MTKQGDGKVANPAGESPVKCGVIMPISATSNHSEKHWADVQKLLHRAISKAGFVPINVWANELTDSVSERIVGNIYSHDMVVADISDLNPNVMFELGLRLASKKPTIVVVNSGGSIPFDIRDFHVIHYPGDLNILGMEDFFSELEGSLTAKYAAYKKGVYSPFLSDVVVDVLTPETRELPLEQLLIDRFDELGGRLSRLERQVLRTSSSRAIPSSPMWDETSQVYIEIKNISLEDLRKIEEYIDNIPGIVSIVVPYRDNSFRIKLDIVAGPVRASTLMGKIRDFVPTLGISPDDLLFKVER